MNQGTAAKRFKDFIVPGEKIAVFIDGHSLYHGSRSLEFDVDYKKLLDLFSNTSLLRAYYFAAMVDTEEYSPLKPLTDWLSYNGYSVITKTAREFTDGAGIRRVKNNVAVEIAVEMIEIAPHVDHIILFSGDSDLKRAVETVKRSGCKISAVSTMKGDHSLIGDELRRNVDAFVDLIDIKPQITRISSPSHHRQKDNAPLANSGMHSTVD